jgi:hypothetical protein
MLHDGGGVLAVLVGHALRAPIEIDVQGPARGVG